MTPSPEEPPISDPPSTLPPPIHSQVLGIGAGVSGPSVLQAIEHAIGVGVGGTGGMVVGAVLGAVAGPAGIAAGALAGAVAGGLAGEAVAESIDEALDPLGSRNRGADDKRSIAPFDRDGTAGDTAIE